MIEVGAAWRAISFFFLLFSITALMAAAPLDLMTGNSFFLSGSGFVTRADDTVLNSSDVLGTSYFFASSLDVLARGWIFLSFTLDSLGQLWSRWPL